MHSGVTQGQVVNTSKIIERERYIDISHRSSSGTKDFNEQEPGLWNLFPVSLQHCIDSLHGTLP